LCAVGLFQADGHWESGRHVDIANVGVQLGFVERELSEREVDVCVWVGGVQDAGLDESRAWVEEEGELRADCRRFLGEVQRFAVGLQDAAFAIVLDGDAGDVGPELVCGGVVVQCDLEGGWHGEGRAEDDMEGVEGKGKILLLPVRYYGRHTDISGQVSCLRVELAGRGGFLVGRLHHRPTDVMVEIGVGDCPAQRHPFLFIAQKITSASRIRDIIHRPRKSSMLRTEM
jgi:hypothetical protein